MPDSLRQKFMYILKKLGPKPLTLAEKCRLQFGAAVLFSLILALLLPFFWMKKLTEKNALDAGRAVADTVFESHFKVDLKDEKSLPKLTDMGTPRQDGPAVVRWVRLKDEAAKDQVNLNEIEHEKLAMLRSDEQSIDVAWTELSETPANYYIRLVRASENCLICHNTRGTAGAFNKNQEIGLLFIKTTARGIPHTYFMNRLLVVVAGLLAATGAMVAFYTIIQRVILRPVRQLRGLVNNVAEGNLDIRSKIETGDEYEKFSDAFNHMLDNLLESQHKLEEANAQLDAKISQLSEKNIELFKANKLKSEFLANMSHEFRTPLNAILGFAELLRDKAGAENEKAKRWSENIITSGRSLLNMINDLLDLAKAEAGKMVLHIEKLGIGQMCEGLITFFTPLTVKKAIDVRLILDDDIPIIQTDPGKIQQILYNLLSNAIKFSPVKGRIVISAAKQGENIVRVSVTDNGPGISKEDQGKIFDKFRQLDGSITRTEEGTGLGLAISKQLSDLLACTISVDSEPGKGATFSLDIPLTISSPDSEQTTD